MGLAVLVAVEVAGFEVTRSFYLVCRPQEYLSPAARAFRDLASVRK